MKPRTPGFNGLRLREAREVRGFTAVALHELTGVSTQSISNYEKGVSTPGPDVLARLAKTLQFPEHFFLIRNRDYERGTMFYRSMSAATKSARIRAEHRFTWLRDITSYLSEFVEYPEWQSPDIDLDDDPNQIDENDIEAAAAKVREQWRMGDAPVANMILLLENHGVITARDSLTADTLESMSEFSPTDQRPYIIIGTDKGTPARWRYDAAHELGHIILHSRLKPEVVKRPETFKLIEQQAHRFASAFLLPFNAFADDLWGATMDAFVALKSKWRVSVAAMIMRAGQGQLISELTQKNLWINHSRRGWKRLEPLDESMSVEEPRILRRAYELLLSTGDQTPEDVVARLGIPAVEVEKLAGLPEGFLSRFSRVSLRSENGTEDRDADVVQLRPRKG